MVVNGLVRLTIELLLVSARAIMADAVFAEDDEFKQVGF